MTMEMPVKLRQRPRYHGLPVPYTTLVKDGVPDFRVVDEYARIVCLRKELCGLCGQPFGKKEMHVFIGGEKSCTGGNFLDPSMHEQCALYAATVCPYLTGVQPHKDAASPNAESEYSLVTAERPARMGLYYCWGFTIQEVMVNLETTEYYIKAGPAIKVDWDTIAPPRGRPSAG